MSNVFSLLSWFVFAVGMFQTEGKPDVFPRYGKCNSTIGYRNTFGETLRTCLEDCRVRNRCYAVMYSRGLSHCALIAIKFSSFVQFDASSQSSCMYVLMRGYADSITDACTRHTCANNQECVPNTSTDVIDGTTYTCVPSECQEAPEIEFAHALSTRCEIGTRNVYMCEFGFETKGNGSFQCGADAEWTKPTISCHFSTGWHMVFRGIPGNGVDVYASWVSGTDVSTDYIECCASHYRHPTIVTDWGIHNFSQVRYSLYKSGEEVAYVTFDGTGSDRINWFSSDRILDSSWKDLYAVPHGIFKTFSIAGEVRPELLGADGVPGRRFFILGAYNECENDEGYTVAITTMSQECTYDNHTAYPQFLYADAQGKAKLEDFAAADVMTIYVKK